METERLKNTNSQLEEQVADLQTQQTSSERSYQALIEQNNLKCVGQEKTILQLRTDQQELSNQVSILQT